MIKRLDRILQGSSILEASLGPRRQEIKQQQSENEAEALT